MSSFKVKLNFIHLNQRKKEREIYDRHFPVTFKSNWSTKAEHAQYMLNHSWLEISVLHKLMRAKFPLQDEQLIVYLAPQKSKVLERKSYKVVIWHVLCWIFLYRAWVTELSKNSTFFPVFKRSCFSGYYANSMLESQESNLFRIHFFYEHLLIIACCIEFTFSDICCLQGEARLKFCH